MNDQKFLIGKPKVYPEKLTKELIRLFSTIPSVKAAYLAQIFIPNSGIPAHPVVGIEMHGNLNEIADELTKVIKKNIPPEECIDVVPTNTKNYIDYFSTIEPFYKAMPLGSDVT